MAPAAASCLLEMRFVELQGPQWLGFACVADTFTGTPRVTPEADPFWCDVDAVPYASMWPDDAIWLPAVLAHGTAMRNRPRINLANFLFRDGTLLDFEFAAGDSVVHRWTT